MAQNNQQEIVTQEETVLIRATVPASVHKELKVQAVINDQTLDSYISEILAGAVRVAQGVAQ